MADDSSADQLKSASSDLSKLAPLPPAMSARAIAKLAKGGQLTERQKVLELNKAAGMTKKAVVPQFERSKFKYDHKLATSICQRLSVSVDSLIGLLREDPTLPTYIQLMHWKAKQPRFAIMLAKAREHQAEYIAQTCLDLAKVATKDNAHAIRVQFDIARWYASKILPAVYGDKPADVKVSTTVQLAIAPERLEDIRSRLESTRSIMSRNESKLNGGAQGSEVHALTNMNGSITTEKQ